MRPVHVQAPPVEQDLVNCPVVLLAGPPPLATPLESTRIQQRVLTRIVPDRLDGLDPLVAVDDEDRVPHRVEPLRIPGGDAELGLDAYDLLDRHRLPLEDWLTLPIRPRRSVHAHYIPKDIHNTTTEFLSGGLSARMNAFRGQEKGGITGRPRRSAQTTDNALG